MGRIYRLHLSTTASALGKIGTLARNSLLHQTRAAQESRDLRLPYAAGSAGSWAALDPATGAILWQKADPNGSNDLGPLTVANGVLYAPSIAAVSLFQPDPPSTPSMFALDASNGNTLWSFAAGSSVIAGASIVDGVVYWGAGYAHLGVPGFTGSKTFYAFSKNGR